MYSSEHYALIGSMLATLVSVTDTTERANYRIHRRVAQVDTLLYWTSTPDNTSDSFISLLLARVTFVSVVFSSREH